MAPSSFSRAVLERSAWRRITLEPPPHPLPLAVDLLGRGPEPRSIASVSASATSPSPENTSSAPALRSAGDAPAGTPTGQHADVRVQLPRDADHFLPSCMPADVRTRSAGLADPGRLASVSRWVASP